jgi:DNA-binding transcriptional LysR family regulator
MAASIVRGLEIFCALVETGSAIGAARRLGVSQPGVSQQIIRLEAELNLVLFARENGRMRPTETGLALYEEARHAFDGLDRVLNLARDIRGLERGVLRIAAPYSMGATFLPRALMQLTKDHPELRIQVNLGTYERIVSLAAAREVDLGIAKAPILAPGLESRHCQTNLTVLRLIPIFGK